MGDSPGANSKTKEEKFIEKIKDLKDGKNNNCANYSEEKIQHIIERLELFSNLEKKTDRDYNYYKAFEIFLCNGKSILRKKGTTKQIVAIENLYQVLASAHTFLGHAGRDVMYKHINESYANVTQQDILEFLKQCEECQLKRGRIKKSIVVQPILSKEFNSRCQVDLIDFQSQPDGPYKFIMNYQDHLTKFIRLRPQETKSAVETAKNIVEIFCELGAPLILQSDNGREFANKLVTEIVKLWPECKIVHGKPRKTDIIYIN